MLQLSQRPLSSSSADTQLFVGRVRESLTILRAVRMGLNCLVLGDRGAGKTSLLRQIERQLLEDGAAVRFVDAGSVDSVQALINRIAETIHGGPKSSSPMAGMAALTGQPVDSELRHLGDGIGAPVVVLLDSISNGSISNGLFGRHREELWELPFIWVVSADAAERKRVLQPPADSFFDAVVMIEDLTGDEAVELLRRRIVGRPIRGDTTARTLKMNIPAIVQQTPDKSPRQLLAKARAIALNADGASASTGRLARQQAIASEIGRPATMLFTELVDRGPVSASDPDLLDALGWTRSRVVQVIQQLEERSLVVSSMEAPEGPGRPRKLWRINPHGVPDTEDAP